MISPTDLPIVLLFATYVHESVYVQKLCLARACNVLPASAPRPSPFSALCALIPLLLIASA